MEDPAADDEPEAEWDPEALLPDADDTLEAALEEEPLFDEAT